MAEFILVDFGAGIGDQIIVATLALGPHAFPEQGAVAAFGEAACPDAEAAMLFNMVVADLGQGHIFVPGFQLVRIDRRCLGTANGVMDIGEAAVMLELITQHLDQIADVSAVNAAITGIDLREYLAELGNRSHKNSEVFVFANAGAVKFLGTLPAQPQQIGIQVAQGRGPIGSDHLGLAGP